MCGVHFMRAWLQLCPSLSHKGRAGGIASSALMLLLANLLSQGRVREEPIRRCSLDASRCKNNRAEAT